MAVGEKGTGKPYLRGRIWWIRYRVPGERDQRFESSGSTDKEVAKRLLREKQPGIDDRTITPRNATVGDLLDLYLADMRRNGRASIADAVQNVELH